MLMVQYDVDRLRSSGLSAVESVSLVLGVQCERSVSTMRSFLCVWIGEIQVPFVDSSNDEWYLVDEFMLAAIVFCNGVESVVDSFVALLTESPKRAVSAHEWQKMLQKSVLFRCERTKPFIVVHVEKAILSIDDIALAQQREASQVQSVQIIHTHAQTINLCKIVKER